MSNINTGIQSQNSGHDAPEVEHDGCQLIHQLVSNSHNLELDLDKFNGLDEMAKFKELVRQMKEKAKELAPNAEHTEHKMKCLLGHNVTKVANT